MDNVMCLCAACGSSLHPGSACGACGAEARRPAGALRALLAMEPLSDHPVELEREPETILAPTPKQSFALRFFLFSCSAVCWVAIVVASLVMTFFIGVVVIAVSRGL